MCFNCSIGITTKTTEVISRADVIIDTHTCKECGYISEDIYDIDGMYIDTRYFDNQGYEIEEED